MGRKLNYTDLQSFKECMTSPEMPNYILRYCDTLDLSGWQQFYRKMSLPRQIVKEEEDLIYLLKWILKGDSDSFTYDLYVQEMMGAEGSGYIDEGWIDVMHEAYYEEFLRDYAPDDYYNFWLEEKSDSDKSDNG